MRDGDRFALSEAGAGAKPDLTSTAESTASAAAMTGGATQRCQTKANAVNSTAPASTGANRNVQGRLPDITSSGLMPAGG